MSVKITPKVVISGTQIGDYPNRSTPYLAGTLTVEIDNGARIGDIGYSSASFSVSSPRGYTNLFRVGKSVLIWVSSDHGFNDVFKGRITSSKLRRSHTGGIVADITATAGEHATYRSTNRRNISLPDLASWEDLLGALKDVCESVTRRKWDVYGPHWQFMPRKSTFTGEQNWKDKTLSSIVSLICERYLLRASINGQEITFKVGRLNLGQAIVIPARVVEQAGSVYSSAYADGPNQITVSYFDGSLEQRETPRYYTYYDEKLIDAFGVNAEYFDTMVFGKDEAEAVTKLIWGRPRDTWALDDVNILLSVAADAGLPIHRWLSMIFDNDGGEITSIAVTGISTMLGLPKRAVGIINRAELRFNPRHDETGLRRAELKITLGPGDLTPDPSELPPVTWGVLPRRTWREQRTTWSKWEDYD